MKNWKNWILILLFLLLVGGFWFIWQKYPKEVVKVEVREDERKIDSLMLVIGEKSLVIDSLKKQKEKVKEKIIVKVEKVPVSCGPPGEGVLCCADQIQDRYSGSAESWWVQYYAASQGKTAGGKCYSKAAGQKASVLA